jgi:broad specificity phosphatase PhoE
MKTLKTLYLVRHGTVHNPNNVIYRRLPGYVLGEQGRREAAQTSLYLAVEPFEVIWHSPLERAVETAEILNIHHHAPLVVEERIHEWDEGESEEAVRSRMADFFEDWRESEYRVSALVSHRDPIRRLLFHLRGAPPAMDDLTQFPLLQAAVYRVTQNESNTLTIDQIFSPDILPTL